ncbi:MAG: DNA-processing protein DprA [Candidatus Roizmanbacteria bacterium]|nr:DNA-processing protein DprA [Candidatus Roizmanbacteria bacterium]
MSDAFDKNNAACLLLSYFPGIGPHLYDEFIRMFGEPRNVFVAKRKDLEPILAGRTNSFMRFRDTFDSAKTISELNAKDIKYIARASDLYPTQLTTIADPPIGLFCKGNVYMWNEVPYCAIVGSRLPTDYGMHVTTDIVKTAVKSGIGVVSGMALGIDAQAHRATLDLQGKTIAVLGCGVDIVYPQQNKSLYDRIVEKGTVISEFPPGMFAKKGMFIARNRIVAALSKVVVCVEGNEHSGALITARYAAEQGRDVAAVPGSVYSNLSKAPHILLREGASLLSKAEDILELFGKSELLYEGAEALERKYTEYEKQILTSLEVGSSTDYIVRTSGLSLEKVSTYLSTLELEGIISRNEMGQWIRTRNPS